MNIELEGTGGSKDESRRNENEQKTIKEEEAETKGKDTMKEVEKNSRKKYNEWIN